jgi:hypothetical protein
MSFLRRNMERASSRVDRWLGVRYSAAYPLYYVIEHPRAGGTWLADMVADALQLPFPKNNLFPLGCTGVLHNHWSWEPRLRNVMYMVRDGRDVAVSLFFYCTRPIRLGADRGMLRYIGRRFPYLVVPGADLGDCSGMLPRFIEDWVRRPYGCRDSWPEHVRSWALDSTGVVVAGYEELRADTPGVLTRVLREVTGKEPDPRQVQVAVERFTFERQTGRQAGSQDTSNAKRKGIVGDWRNHFSREAGEVFDRHCGEMLMRLGYERDRDWWKALPALDELRARRVAVPPIESVAGS